MAIIHQKEVLPEKWAKYLEYEWEDFAILRQEVAIVVL